MRYTQPQTGLVKIDYGNPITRGLVFAFDGALPGINHALRTPIVPLVSTAQVAVRDGLSPLFVIANNTGLSLGADARFDPPALTIFVIATISQAGVNATNNILFARDDATLGRSFTVDLNGSSSSKGLRFYVNGGGTVGTNELSENVTATAGRRYVAAATYAPGTASLFSNGVRVSSSNTFATKGVATGDVQIGRRTYTGFTESFDGTIPVALMWNRVLTDVEVALISANPWLLFSAPKLLFTSAAVQLLGPTSDLSAGTWTASSGPNLYAMLNEMSANDATFDVTSQASTFKVGIAAGANPGVTTGHVVRYRIIGSQTVSLMQGVTVIASWSQAPTVMTTFVQNVTAIQAATITDYTTLSLQFQAT